MWWRNTGITPCCYLHMYCVVTMVTGVMMYFTWCRHLESFQTRVATHCKPISSASLVITNWALAMIFVLWQCRTLPSPLWQHLIPCTTHTHIYIYTQDVNILTSAWRAIMTSYLSSCMFHRLMVYTVRELSVTSPLSCTIRPPTCYRPHVFVFHAVLPYHAACTLAHTSRWKLTCLPACNGGCGPSGAVC